jgi:succinyl-diaminopimelate desuccinylase
MNPDKKTLRKEIASRVAKYRDDLVAITQSLIRIPSVNPPGDYEAMAKRMGDLYRGEGLNPIVTGASREEIESLGLTYPRPDVIALHKGTEGAPVFCLDAHMDVVGVGEKSRWTYPPFAAEIHDGKIYGRGAEDTKCHLAAQIIVYRTIKEMDLNLRGDLILSSTVDDEIGAWPGMGYLLEKGFREHGFPKPDYHVAGEPTGLESLGCLARGRLWYEYVLKGVSAHGGNPKEGVNAIEKAIALANAVKTYPIHTDPLMGSDTINIGILQGGEAINVVPSRCKITFDIRPATKTEVVKAFMERTIKGLKKSEAPFDVESVRLLNDRQTGGIGPDHEFVQRVRNVVGEMTGKKVAATGSMVGYSSLGNAYWSSRDGRAGIMYGGGDFLRAHSVDEFITIDELVETTQVFAGIVLEICM